MLREAVEALRIQPDGMYVDTTFGRGGHTGAILSLLGSEGRLFAMDRDPEAEHCAATAFRGDARFVFARAAFSRLAEMMDRYGVRGSVQGILFDLGVSSPQLDDPRRGFSFSKEGPLDMRMDPADGRMSAAQWLASCSTQELAGVLKEFGEERYHRLIAKAVIAARQSAPINSTLQLAQIVASVMPIRERYKHPATRSFQAIRIFINQELAELQAGLRQALQVLAPAGRLVVISFHSLEDRIVKRFMRQQAQGLEWPPDLPVPASQQRCHATLRVIGHPMRPSVAEIQANPRARGAVLRVAERLA